MKIKRFLQEQHTAWFLMKQADCFEEVKNSQDKGNHRPYIVLQNREKNVGLMTYAAQVVELSEYADRADCQLVVDLKTYPCVNLADDRVGIDNAWEYYYEQPFQEMPELDVIYNDYSYRFTPQYRKDLLSFFPGINRSIIYRFLYNKESMFHRISVIDCVRDPKIAKRWFNISSKYLRLNEKTKLYVDDEYQRIMQGKRVLGVSLRGTDYTKKRTYGHPIQPEIGKIIDDAREYMQNYGYSHIYLSCEEYAAVESFEMAFPGKILVNNRKFFDKIDFERVERIADVSFDRENDAYLRGLEYLSSIYLLSRCDALIAGQNTGSQMAYIINGGKYEHVYFYDIGKYGIDD